MFKTNAALLTTALATAIFISGCAKPAEKDAKAPEDSGVETASLIDRSTPQPKELIGIWWGTGALNEDQLALAIRDLSPLEQQQLVSAAEAFMATEMAIEFKADGSMETVIEVLTESGRREAGVELGQWSASPMTVERKFKVQTTSDQSNGAKTTDIKTIHLADEGKQISFQVNVPGLLGKCSPQIVLELQEIQSVAQEPNGSMR
jgi:hypothetical protein